MEYDITNIVITLLIGIGLGLALVALYIWHIIAKFEKQIHEAMREVVKEVEKSLMPVIVEQEGDEIFVYSEKERQFLVQGKSAREIREKFDQRFPDRIAYMAGGDADLIEQLKSELKVIKEKDAKVGI